MALSERWRLLVTGEERIDKIIGIAELAYAVQPIDEVVRQAKQIESSIFETSNSKENYASTMDKLILNMKELIENKSRSNLEQLATKSIQGSVNERIMQIREEMEMEGKSININDINDIISDDDDDEDAKKVKELLRIEQQLLKESWQKYIDEKICHSHQQQKLHAERLRLSIRNMQLQRFVNPQQNVSSSPPSSSSSSYSSTSTSDTNPSDHEIHSSSKPSNSLSSSISPDASTIPNSNDSDDQIIHTTSSLLENL